MSPLVVPSEPLAVEADGPPTPVEVRADVDGDDVPELLSCDDQGVRAFGPDGQLERTLWRQPCRALAAGASRWWFVGTELSAVSGAATPEPWAEVAPGPVALAADGADGVWLATERVALHLVAGEVVARVPTFGGVSALVTTDLDGDGAPDLVLTHPDARLVGVIGGAETSERSFPVAVRPTWLRADERGVSTGDDEAVVWLLRTDVPAEPVPAPAPPPDPEPTPAPPPAPPPPARIEGKPLGWSERPERLEGPRTHVMGLSLPDFAATDGTLASGRTPSSVQVTGSAGLVAGALLGPGRGIGGSVIAAAAIEQRTALGRAWFGLDSAPLLLAAGDTTVWHLGFASAGLTWGSPHVRSGPYATVGLVGAGAGWRTLIQPFEQPSGATHGLEARLAVLVGPTIDGQDVEPVGEAALSWSSTFQLGRSSGRWSPAPVTLPSSAPSEGPLTCRRFAIAIGGEVTTSSAELSWEHVGQDVDRDVTGSPAASVACDTGRRHAGWFASGQSAPWAAYRTPVDGGDRSLFHMGSASLGAFVGGDVARVGPLVTAGIWRAGAGVRAVLTPFASKRGVHQGLDLRGEILVPAASSYAATAAWTVWLDPRRGDPNASRVER